MKKLLLSLLACGSIAAANAQAGSILLYGNAGFTTDKQPGATSSTINWNVNPGVGYQFNENWTVGVNIGWAQNGFVPAGATTTDKQFENTYNVGPFVRYTQSFWHSKIFYWYGQLNAGYQGSYSTYMSEPTFDKTHGFNVNVVPTVGANLGHSFCLNFSVGGVGYTTTSINGTNVSSGHNFNVNFGQGATFGISKNFGGSHMHRGHHEPMDETRSMDTSDDNGGDSTPHHKKHHTSDDE